MFSLGRSRNLKILASVTLASIVAFSVAGFLSPVKTVHASIPTGIRFASQEELEEARRQRDAALAQASQAAAIVSDLSAERAELNGELAELNTQQEIQNAEYELIASQYAAALIAKAEALDRYVQAQDDLAATQKMFEERVATMFEYQNKSILEVLLESNSLAGFFTNIEIISLIADADSQAVDSMQVALDTAQNAADVALAEAEEMEAQAVEKQAQLAELEEQIGITTNSIANLDAQISSAEATASNFNAQAASLNAEISRIQNELYAQAHPTPPPSATNSETGEQISAPAAPAETTPQVGGGNGALQWPSWTHYLTSYFGYRYHPVTGQYKYHSGIDIGCGFGDTIMAAGSGTVICVDEPVEGQNYGGSGYGNYCMIQHDNGLVTLYGHARDIIVSNGEYVSAGQAIGYVGSTGTSTGAHLHFEVRSGGERVDPLTYLP